MDHRKLGLQILGLFEMIISARILLFTVPVLIHKFLLNNSLIQRMDDWFVILITFAALFYLIIGFACLGGHKFWKLFHYLAAPLIGVLTFGLFYKLSQIYAPMNLIYFLPLLCSLLLILLIRFERLLLKEKK